MAETMSNDLYDRAKSVDSRQSFVRFVQLLASDARENRSGWENGNVDTFLAGLAGYTQDMHGYYSSQGEDVDIDIITWRMAAQMLLAATVYE